MFDYYTVLAGAVSDLEPNNARTRQDLYERARTILITHLETSNIKRSTEEITKARMAFETAIQKVEANLLLNMPRAGLPAERAD